MGKSCNRLRHMVEMMGVKCTTLLVGGREGMHKSEEGRKMGKLENCNYLKLRVEQSFNRMLQQKLIDHNILMRFNHGRGERMLVGEYFDVLLRSIWLR